MSLLEDLMQQPWTWIGPRFVQDPAGDHFEMRIAELPDFFVAGDSAEEIKREAPDALRAFLGSFVSEGELPPLPVRLWEIQVFIPQRTVEIDRTTPAKTDPLDLPFEILEPDKADTRTSSRVA